MENRIIKFRAWDGDKIIYQSEDGWFDKVKHPEYQSPQCMQFASVMRVCKIMQFTRPPPAFKTSKKQGYENKSVH